MDVFNRKHHLFCIYKGLNILNITCIVLLLLSTTYSASAQDDVNIAVLPFVINTSGMPDDLPTGIQDMFISSISKKGYYVIPSSSVNSHPLAFKATADDLLSIGKDLDAGWVVSGVLTKEDEKITLTVTFAGSRNNGTPIIKTNTFVAEGTDQIPDAAVKFTETIHSYISGADVVSSIQVQGNKRIESDAILAQINTQKGGKFNEEALDQDLRAIYKMGYFKDVQIDSKDESDGKALTINVVELPYITEIAFQGNKEYKEDKLNEELGLKKFAVLNLSEVKQSINRLKDFYKKNGYYNVSITEKVEERPNNEALLAYVIDEGEKIHITKIEFLGNEVYSDDDLLDLMNTNEKGFFSFMTNSGVLQRDKLDNDILILQAFYDKNGYLDAKIGEPEIVYDAEKGITITVTIVEGMRYKVGAIKVEGDIIKPETEILVKMSLPKQEYFSREVLIADREILRNIYADEGYAHADISISTPPREENNETYIDTTYTVNKNKKVRIERIDIAGNTTTRDKVIRRELKLIEGDYFSGTKIEKSKASLYRLTYLDNPEIKTSDGSSDELMDLEVNVTEKSSGTFEIGGGYSDYDKLFGIIGISKDNIFGKGESVSIDAQVGSRTREYKMSYTEPWLFDKPVSGTATIYDWETEYDYYTKDSTGGQMGIAFLLGIDDYTRGTVSYAYDDAYISTSYSSYSPVLQDILGKNTKSSVTTGLSRDSRDRLYVTSKGSVNSISMEFAGGPFGGTSYFNRVTASSAWYIPIWWNHVLMIKGSAGIVEKRSGGKLPIYERFTLGGMDTVRGYDSESISPKDPYTGDAIGGERMWLGNIEYRIPILKEQGVVGVAFFDAGNAYNEDESWNRRSKRAYGFGMRWLSPMGPLRLEYGFKLDREPGESSGELHFNISPF
jgi:outer membrane protein insertion porin family